MSTSLLGELAAFGLAIGFSPLHIGLLLGLLSVALAVYLGWQGIEGQSL